MPPSEKRKHKRPINIKNTQFINKGKPIKIKMSFYSPRLKKIVLQYQVLANTWLLGVEI